jgi:hypothetical protein
MATASFRQQVATAIRDGIERYDPDIAIRASQIRAWHAQHPGAAVSTPAPAPRGAAAAAVAPSHSMLGTLIFWTVIVGGILAVLRWPKLAVWLVVSILTLFVRMTRSAIVHRSALRRRRRVLAGQAARAAHPPSVYDELWL